MNASTTDLGTGVRGPLTCKEERQVVIASTLGTLFEWYDLFIYGSLALFMSQVLFHKTIPLSLTGRIGCTSSRILHSSTRRDSVRIPWRQVGTEIQLSCNRRHDERVDRVEWLPANLRYCRPPFIDPASDIARGAATRSRRVTRRSSDLCGRAL